MKKLVFGLMMVLLVTGVVFAGGGGDSDKINLTLGSWRTDDVAQINALLEEYKKVAPNVNIEFQPTNPPDYNATLRLQLESGTGPDLMYARSYATGEQLFDDGYFADVTDLPGLQENFQASSLAPWQTKDGKSFGIPFTAIVQVVYFNKDLFAEVGVEIPETWDEFFAAAEKFEAAGITPVANGLADEWDINECFMMAILPGVVGGLDGRLAYEAGNVPLNDAKMVEAFEIMGQVADYLPNGFEALTYNDSIALFATGQAAMYFDGSWTAGAFADVPFEWGTFAPPVPAGNEKAITFHPDTGMTYNTATKYPEEAKAFLSWLCSVEGATAAAKLLPNGFFPMIDAAIPIEDAHAAEILSLTQGRLQDARFVWPRFMDSEPSGYALMNQGVISVMKGDMTAQEAADELAEGVGSWYRP